MERTDNVTENRIQLLREGLSSFPVKPTDRQLQQFLDYYDILTEWNQVMNLTAITDYEEVVAKHFVDSISLIQVITTSSIVALSVDIEIRLFVFTSADENTNE